MFGSKLLVQFGERTQENGSRTPFRVRRRSRLSRWYKVPGGRRVRARMLVQD